MFGIARLQKAHTRIYARRKRHKGWEPLPFKPCRAEGAEVPVFSWVGIISHNMLSGLRVSVIPIGFYGDIKPPPLFSLVTRLCVASVAVSPYNLFKNQNRCPGVYFHVYFPRLVARKILMESEALTPVTKRF